MATLDGSISTTRPYYTAFHNDLYTIPLPPNTDPGQELLNPMQDVVCSLAGAPLDCTSISTNNTGAGSFKVQVDTNPAVSPSLRLQVLTSTVSLYVWEPVNVSIIILMTILY